MNNDMEPKPIQWKNGEVIILDQRRLPSEEVYISTKRYQEVVMAIKDMAIRGAPAIGIAAAFGIAIGAKTIVEDMGIKDKDHFRMELEMIFREFASSRPTAVNLFWAIDRMKDIVQKNTHMDVEELSELLVEEAMKIYEEDMLSCKRIGHFGKELIGDGFRILTHCNAGGLATAGYGTALGVIRAAFEEGKKIFVFVDETRPFLQGSRLTAWELKRASIPFCVITDNMAGYFMKKGEIDCIIVGADRITSYGDVANKIGTYTIAVLAKAHRIPFYVAAPISTVDFSKKNPEEIPIEERDPSEVTHFMGIQITPYGSRARNPAFDVTPRWLISAIITDKGIAKRPYISSLKRLREKNL